MAITTLRDETFSNRQFLTRIYMNLIIVLFNFLHSALYNYHARRVYISISIYIYIYIYSVFILTQLTLYIALENGVLNKATSLINKQLDAQFLLYISISILYMFRANLCSSSGESIVSIQHLVYVTLCRRPDGHLHRVTYTRCFIDTIYSPDDEHKVGRNM
jgi:hypothetical protein